ncbi:hypothetical protein BO71DRAFT_228634 [Aspergillus ellipticus CBS 707.79]|uniref:Uncharacterized protein n=1 Tax=Aspergillus ellipticus CBS 707.79 TaxID=1448320 RepID=A0A319ETH6_9EURO|nr:hypothetical protein BO71DRAFT_228634 [Aspergillus ellipticus CBS 707.79]
MDSSILHHCSFCGQATAVSNALGAFVENPYCSQCGLSATESTVHLHDDLAILFDKSMNIGLPLSSEDREKCCPHSSPAMYSITQHYHHSAHIARQMATADPLAKDFRMHTEGTDILRQHKIDPSSLSLQQLELFEGAIPEQRSRLIQIWQISPEHRYEPNHDIIGDSLPKLEASSGVSTMAEAPYQSYRTPASSGHKNVDDSLPYAEPYMVNGYEARENNVLSAPQAMHPINEPTSGRPRRLATDPVYHYAQSRGWWESVQSGSMEYQYGLFEEMERHSHCGLPHHNKWN